MRLLGQTDFLTAGHVGRLPNLLCPCTFGSWFRIDCKRCLDWLGFDSKVRWKQPVMTRLCIIPSLLLVKLEDILSALVLIPVTPHILMAMTADSGDKYN